MFQYDYLLNSEFDLRIFVIRRKQKTKAWFLHDVESTSQLRTVIWTPRLVIARAFPSEEDVEEFKYANLRHQSCDIVEVKLT